MAVAMNDKVFPSDRMTSRERLLAAYRGEAVDRLPFWAKVTNDNWRGQQPKAVAALSEEALLDAIRADGIFHSPGFARLERPHIRVETRDHDHGRALVTHTPDGDLVEELRYDRLTQTWHPSVYPVKTREDVARFRWALRDVRVRVDDEALERGQRRREAVGERGILKQGWGTTPLMKLVEHIVGPVQTHYMLADCPEEMDALIAEMHAANLALVRAVAERTPADLVVSVENTSTTLISPEQFRRYCLRHLVDVGRAVEGAGKMHELHMCGKTKALLGEIDTIPASSMEAFTSPTLGDTRLSDGRTRAPSKTLVGGTNVNVWLWRVERIQSYVLDELEACPDTRRIVLTTAGVAPPGCPAAKFRAVGEWLSRVGVRN